MQKLEGLNPLQRGAVFALGLEVSGTSSTRREPDGPNNGAQTEVEP